MSRAVAITLSALVFGAVLAAVPMVENLYARVAAAALAYWLLAICSLRIAERYQGYRLQEALAMSRAVAITLSALVFGAILAAVPMVENLYARTAVSGLAYGFLAFSLLRIAKRYGKS